MWPEKKDQGVKGYHMVILLPALPPQAPNAVEAEGPLGRQDRVIQTPHGLRLQNSLQKGAQARGT